MMMMMMGGFFAFVRSIFLSLSFSIFCPYCCVWAAVKSCRLFIKFKLECWRVNLFKQINLLRCNKFTHSLLFFVCASRQTIVLIHLHRFFFFLSVSVFVRRDIHSHSKRKPYTQKIWSVWYVRIFITHNTTIIFYLIYYV